MLDVKLPAKLTVNSGACKTVSLVALRVAKQAAKQDLKAAGVKPEAFVRVSVRQPVSRPTAAKQDVS